MKISRCVRDAIPGTWPRELGGATILPAAGEDWSWAKPPIDTARTTTMVSSSKKLLFMYLAFTELGCEDRRRHRPSRTNVLGMLRTERSGLCDRSTRKLSA